MILIGGLEKQSSSNVGDQLMSSLGKKGLKGRQVSKGKSKKKPKHRKSINGLKANSQKVEGEEENPEGNNPDNLLR